MDSEPVIYREYCYAGRWGEVDPGATHPMQTEWLRRQERTIEGVDLLGAVRAELAVEYWGGHIGTSGQQFRVNGHDWIDIPQPVGTPAAPHHYYRTLLGNPAAPVPLEHLKSGSNAFVFAAGPQTKYDFGFGFYWVYAFTLRVYCDASVPHTAATVVYPQRGDVIGDHPVLLADVEGDGVVRADFIGYYDDFDWAGNGRFRDWHYQYRDGAIHRHLGTAASAPYAVTWENTWVPDQKDVPMRIKARITDASGIVFETPAVDDIRLSRPGRSVHRYPATDVPEVFGMSRAGRGTCTIPVPDPVDRLRDARMAISTWSGGELHEIGINGRPIAGALGRVNNYGFDVIPVPPEAVHRGDNVFHGFSFSDYHKAEINWPGPVLLLEFEAEDEAARTALEQSALGALGHHHCTVRAYAARQLGTLHSRPAVPRLIAALEDEAWEVRAAAAYALGEIGDPAATRPLIDVLRREPPFTPHVWEVRRDAAHALSRMRGPEAKAILEEADRTADNLLKNYTRHAIEILREAEEGPVE